ncbi:DUF3857 domain-containing protein [Flavobacterium psychrotrophum]|uniref:DUF3857 domain-containing protein n=1 Tax=Flavobacterium psychrotrophum TaxID=2294119 RepID=UPI000E30C658|nr:DUF3857 domain-containing transglutaminase family protein [Flavobacterium psychrotrophum]
MILRIALFLLALIGLQSHAQQNYNYALIPESLTENANAVVRQERYDIVIASRRSMKTTFLRAVTILNEHGQRYMGTGVYYDKSTAIKSVEAIIYDKNGTQIKKIKRKEFLDHSVSSGTEITDGRTLSLDYTPVAYPFTVVFSYETETSNTAFIPQWSPVEGAFCSTEKEEINITSDPSLGLKYKEYNFGEVILNKQQQATTSSFSAANIPAYRSEDYAPSLDRTKPKILFALEKFHLEGVDGEAASWEAFGSWMYNSLLQGTDELPEATVAKIRSLVGAETDALKKAKIVYKYMQGKTRYVSIQLGIGGWKPMPAKDVDRLGYGDCKALSNYTRALLKAVDVPAYYTIIYAGNGHRSLTSDFVSMQGNHAILAIPYNNQLVWLECTSQSMPFGFQGDFTDNRMALLVKPDKGELVRTHVYDTKGNTQLTTASYNVLPDGALNGSLKRVSNGLQYDDKFSWAALAPDELSKMYKENTFANINNLKLKKTTLTNDDDVQQFTEDIALEAAGYCNSSGGRMIFAVNAFNQNTAIPQRYRTRRLPLNINTGFYDHDEVTINLPDGYTMEAMPQNVTLTDKFGEYKAEFSLLNPTQLLYKRSLTINNGEYAKEDYDKYREFREKIARNDNAKVVLVKK